VNGGPVSGGTGRRAVLTALGLGTAPLVLAACGDDGGAAPDTGAMGTPAPGCVLSPAGTEGPYYLDLDLMRRDLTEGRPGVPLLLRLTVVDTDGCRPLPEAAVDIWHADAEGIYSGFEEGRGARFLRGVQLTDAAGTAEFDTIVPGWYDNRTMHIHAKVHAGGDTVHTGQLYFDEELSAAVSRAEPYAGRGDPRTANADDFLFPSGGAQSVLRTSGSAKSGYTASLTLGVQR
jgi:hypothetical protein